MNRFMFSALNELKSDIVVADKLLEKTSTSNYWKRAHTIRIKNAHAKHVFTFVIIYASPRSLLVQSVACQSNKSNSAITITANKMDANNQTINSKSTRSKGYILIDVLYIVKCIIHWLDPRLPPDYKHHYWLWLPHHRVATCLDPVY